jgi:uncharacterized membrane protein
MSLYSLALFVHIGAAIVLMGGSLLATPAIRTAVLRAGTVAEMRTWLTFGRPLSRITPIAAFTLLGSGVYLTQTGRWWTAAWLQIALALWAANMFLAVRVVEPAVGRLGAEAAAADGPVSALLDALRRSRRWSVTSDVMLANDVGVLYLMVAKPGYLGSVGTLLVAYAAVGGIRAFRRPATGRRAEPAEPAPGVIVPQP